MSPVGTAVYPRLTKPDDKFDADGAYSVKLRMKAEDAEEFETELKDIYAEHYKTCLAKASKKKLKKSPHWPIKVVEDDQGDETDEVEINFKMKALVRPKNGDPFEKRPVLIDGKCKPITGEIKLGGGSTLKIKAELNLWANPSLGVGVTLEPKVVQVINLVEYTPGADTSGFEEVEDGFEAEEISPDAEGFNDTGNNSDDTDASDDETPDF
jgi:hypothetical protein